MKKISTRSIVAFGAAMLACATVEADEGYPRTPIEITLFGGYNMSKSLTALETEYATAGGTTRTDSARFKKGAAYSLALNWEAEPNAYYEVSYSRQSTTLEFSSTATPTGGGAQTHSTSESDASIEYFQVGGYVTFAEDQARVIPYFLLTVGGARFTPSGQNLDDVTKFAAAIGGGVKVVFTRHIALRLDARAYATFFENENEYFCQEPGVGCNVHLEGETLVQPQASLGFTVGF
jgi:Outer membrane protein beta-barrel domain